MNEERNTLFSSKEEYIAFTDKWKQFLAEGGANVSKNEDGLRDSPLTSEFHLFYSLARGKGAIGFKEGSDGLRMAKIHLSNQYAITTQLKHVFGNTISDEMITKVQMRA